MVDIIELKALSDLRWNFDDGKPYFNLDTGKYQRNEYVDPCPAYANGLQNIRAAIGKVLNRFKIEFPIKIFSLDREIVGRTNAWASYDAEWGEGSEAKKLFPYIILSGKRIPIHPAMTRYLIPHEYGHLVQYYIEFKSKNKNLLNEYADLREIKTQTHYGPGMWHESVGEIFANDFRILVCGMENEFWPHDVVHPFQHKEITNWWIDAVNKYNYKE